MRVLKQVLEIKDRAVYWLPGENITLLSVQEQRGELVLYFKTDATDNDIVCGSPTTRVHILIAGTGHKRDDIPDDAQYFGTVMMSYGLVWHCFVEE